MPSHKSVPYENLTALLRISWVTWALNSYIIEYSIHTVLLIVHFETIQILIINNRKTSQNGGLRNKTVQLKQQSKQRGVVDTHLNTTGQPTTSPQRLSVRTTENKEVKTSIKDGLTRVTTRCSHGPRFILIHIANMRRMGVSKCKYSIFTILCCYQSPWIGHGPAASAITETYPPSYTIPHSSQVLHKYSNLQITHWAVKPIIFCIQYTQLVKCHGPNNTVQKQRIECFCLINN